jgi:ribosomal protein S18 acetylase RimI-like enzyme
VKTVEIEPLNIAEEAVPCAQMLVSAEPWRTLQVTFEGALERMRDPRLEIYVVRDTAGVAGFIILNMQGLLAGYIQTVCVRPDRQGQGLGSMLIRWAEDRISRDSPNVFMCVSSFNPRARQLYERLGYEQVGVLRAFVVAEHDELLLRKTRGSWTQFRNRASGTRTPGSDSPHALRVRLASVTEVIESGLIAELDADLMSRYPGEPTNGIDPEEFRSSGGVFVVAERDEVLMGCGAFRPLDDSTVEVKRMFVRPPYRGESVGRTILTRLENEARIRGFTSAVLETGNRQAEAIALYDGSGYRRVERFGAYIHSEKSICFRKTLVPAQGD